jgi:DNA-directed RNA polymerase subunit M/transcription elongation factor TFIIS
MSQQGLCPQCGAVLEPALIGESYDKFLKCDHCGYQVDVPDERLVVTKEQIAEEVRAYAGDEVAQELLDALDNPEVMAKVIAGEELELSTNPSVKLFPLKGGNIIQSHMIQIGDAKEAKIFFAIVALMATVCILSLLMSKLLDYMMWGTR